jgi:choline dehydrogenase-like flavoprotein
VLLSTTMTGFGAGHADMMRQFPHLQGMLALLRDGFHPDSRGGAVELGAGGAAVLDYPLNDPVWDGARRALLTMAEIQFAAGATAVQVAHETAPRYASWRAAKEGIGALPFRTHLTRVASAHVMGGCMMAGDPRAGVTGQDGRYHGLANLSVHDGSLFPTSIGANPQLSIYGITARLASQLAQSLTGLPAARPVRADGTAAA